MLHKRLEEEDCNAGVIYDCLFPSEYWEDEKTAIEIICEAQPEQNIQMVLFNFQTERQGEPLTPEEEEKAERESHIKQDDETLEVCTNYRFQRRNDPKFNVAVEDDKKDNEQSQ